MQNSKHQCKKIYTEKEKRKEAYFPTQEKYFFNQLPIELKGGRNSRKRQTLKSPQELSLLEKLREVDSAFISLQLAFFTLRKYH